jgi:hypothetical protein
VAIYLSRVRQAVKPRETPNQEKELTIPDASLKMKGVPYQFHKGATPKPTAD